MPIIVVSIDPEVFVKMYVPYDHQEDGGYPKTVRLRVPQTEEAMRKSHIFSEFFNEPHRPRDRKFVKILLERYAGKTLRFKHKLEGFYSDLKVLK